MNCYTKLRSAYVVVKNRLVSTILVLKRGATANEFSG